MGNVKASAIGADLAWLWCVGIHGDGRQVCGEENEQ